MGSEIENREDEVIRLRALVINLENRNNRLRMDRKGERRKYFEKLRALMLANHALTFELDEQKTINTQQGMLIDLLQHVLFAPVHNSKITS